MKRSILSPLCSALIIPGLGQVINHHYKKGLIILAIVFILFIAGTVKLAVMINSLIGGLGIDRLDSEVIMQRLQAEDISGLTFLLIAFGIVWLYSVLDAFLEGRKMDKRREGVLNRTEK
jgi:ABC-type uncharacterized transport system fused permease/ATPase subunit